MYVNLHMYIHLFLYRLMTNSLCVISYFTFYSGSVWVAPSTCMLALSQQFSSFAPSYYLRQRLSIFWCNWTGDRNPQSGNLADFPVSQDIRGKMGLTILFSYHYQVFFWRTVRLKFRQFKFLYRPFVCLGHESWGHRGQIQDRKKQIQQENQCVISSVGIVTLWHLEYQINKAMINTILLFLDV